MAAHKVMKGGVCDDGDVFPEYVVIRVSDDWGTRDDLMTAEDAEIYVKELKDRIKEIKAYRKKNQKGKKASE